MKKSLKSTDSRRVEPTQKSTKSTKLKKLNKILNIYTGVGVVLWIAATILILIPSFPHIWYRINAQATDQEVDTIIGPTLPDADKSVSFGDIISKYEAEYESNKVELPPLDKSLPKTNKLKISKIGVNGKIYEGKNAEKTLEKGIWRVNDYGTPEDEYTIILASHRFGHITWSSSFRKANSFYNLPKTKVGDTVEIIWHQRKYKYEIYKAEESTKIKDYEADLILYTCKMINSPVRIFRYAKRVN